MKKPCTITLYKHGKLLVQGREEHKKLVRNCFLDIEFDYFKVLKKGFAETLSVVKNVYSG